jgi:SAM-dependent methyltransferase
MSDAIRLGAAEMVLRDRVARMELEVDYTGEYSSFVFDIYAYNRHHVHPDTHLGWWRLPLEPGVHRGELRFDVSTRPYGVSFHTAERSYQAEDFWFNEEYALEPLETAIFVLRDRAEKIVEMRTVLLKVGDRDLLAGFYEQLHARGEYSRATGSNPFLSTLHRDKLRLLERLMRRWYPEGGEILDIGSGPGIITTLFDPLPYRLTCLDLSHAIMEQRSIEYPGARWMVGSAETLPFKAGSFDGLLCGEIIEHLFEPESVLEEWRRVIRDGGILILSTPNIERLTNRLNRQRQPFAPDHVNERSLAEWRELLEGAGFEVLTATGIYLELWLNFFDKSPWIDLLQKRHNKPWARPLMHLFNSAGRLWPSRSLDLIFVARAG